jgi:hypothetical protein
MTLTRAPLTLAAAAVVATALAACSRTTAPAETPEVSPAGVCDCITVVYEGAQLLLDLGASPGITEVEALADVTGDSRAELAVRSYSGGAHCCESTSVYSVEHASPRTLLSVDTGNCQGEFIDLDGDAAPEFRTCDDRFAYEFCAFAFSPMPPVVFAYDRGSGQFHLRTPAFADVMPRTSIDEVRIAMRETRDDRAIEQCTALGAALELVYLGRPEEGWALFRDLYTAQDAESVEQRAQTMLAGSELLGTR